MTAALIDIDMAENDRLLIQEEQRRLDLIETAVRSFAPHLTGKSDVKCVHLYSTNNALRKVIRETFEGSKTIVVEHCPYTGRDRKGVNEIQQDIDIWLDIPKTADLVVTKSNLNSKTELLAAQLRALPLVLPEGTEYLHKRLDRAGVLVLVGADQGRR